MKIKDGKVVIGIFAITIIAVATFAILKTGPGSKTMMDKNEFSNLPSAGLPPSWYMHRIDDTTTIFTKQKELPNIGNTEMFAYGEQITVASVKLDRPLKEWVAWSLPDNDPLIKLKESSVLNNHQLIKVESEVEASGKTLSYYLFGDTWVYIFTLYPLETYDTVGEKMIRNVANIQALQQIVKDYADKI